MVNGTELYAGYIEDIRMTDQSWVEATLLNYHDDSNVLNDVVLRTSDASTDKVAWIQIHKNMHPHTGQSALFAAVSSSRYRYSVLHSSISRLSTISTS